MVGGGLDRVTRQVDRWTSRQVNKLLKTGDRVTEERRKVTEGVLSLTEYTDEQNTQSHTETLSQPITQNVTAIVGCWVLSVRC